MLRSPIRSGELQQSQSAHAAQRWALLSERVHCTERQRFAEETHLAENLQQSAVQMT